MKTILIVISKDIIIRNIFDTDFWPSLVKNILNTRIVLLVEKEKVEYFRERFRDADDIIGYKRESYSGYNKFLMFLVRTGIRSHSTTTYRWRAYKRGHTGLLITLIKSLISQTLGRMRLYKYFIRILVIHMHISDEIKNIYNEINPDIIFTPSLIDTDFDVPIAVEARRLGIHVVGMVRSWDNLNNHGLLAFVPDRFIVQNAWLKGSAEKFQAIPKGFIKDVVGLPHYDLYKDTSRYIKSREEFFTQYGLDLNKKLILLGGSDFYYTEDVLPKVINKLIESKQITEPVQVIFRPHPVSLFNIKEYKLNELKHIALDPTFVDTGTAKFSNEEKFVNLMTHSDIIINIASTLSIDGAVFDTPVICINFDDSARKLSRWESVHRLYDTFDHYEQLVKTGGVRTPQSHQELAKDINDYLKDPSIDKEGRKQILENFVEPFDGKTSERLATILVKETSNIV